LLQTLQTWKQGKLVGRSITGGRITPDITQERTLQHGPKMETKKTLRNPGAVHGPRKIKRRPSRKKTETDGEGALTGERRERGRCRRGGHLGETGLTNCEAEKPR